MAAWSRSTALRGVAPAERSPATGKDGGRQEEASSSAALTVRVQRTGDPKLPCKLCSYGPDVASHTKATDGRVKHGILAANPISRVPGQVFSFGPGLFTACCLCFSSSSFFTFSLTVFFCFLFRFYFRFSYFRLFYLLCFLFFLFFFSFLIFFYFLFLFWFLFFIQVI